jgi:hypothetical protein
MLIFALATIARGDGPFPLAIGTDHVAIKGYDAVAYFTDGKATKGSSDFEYWWDDARWQFATAANRDLFIADPDRYAPQFGGYCTGAVGNGELVPADPNIWAIVDGKLYMSAGSPFDFVPASIAKAQSQWPAVQTNWEPPAQ